MVNLETIAVNGQTLTINPQVFKTTRYRGTMVDSGTTLGYLAEEAYDIFVNAITKAVSQHVRAFDGLTSQFYRTTSSVDIFPVVSLNFTGGAAMLLRGEDYLVQQFSIGAETVWCMGFQKFPGRGLTILRDMVLKDKIVIYDLARQQIGWASYNCSQSVKVSATTSNACVASISVWHLLLVLVINYSVAVSSHSASLGFAVRMSRQWEPTKIGNEKKFESIGSGSKRRIGGGSGKGSSSNRYTCVPPIPVSELFEEEIDLAAHDMDYAETQENYGIEEENEVDAFNLDDDDDENIGETLAVGNANVRSESVNLPPRPPRAPRARKRTSFA
ncbi:putative MKI67 FHA domain-interacting nucleolar phosphoprotein-like [Capsicum annuum]|nr:putative MKI67 FHA domain-interacting nucleolar phosphoprotein-like [Capsicum annuum]